MRKLIFITSLCVIVVIAGLVALRAVMYAPDAASRVPDASALESSPSPTQDGQAATTPGTSTGGDDLASQPGASPGAGTSLETDSASGDDVQTTPDFDYLLQAGQFELPVNGAAGWAAASLPMRSEPLTSAPAVVRLVPGQGFTILQEQGYWWNVRLEDGLSGWVEHGACFINLPDIIPSIVYNITNAYSSLMRSGGFDIPNVTGQALFEARAYNPRLGRDEFIAPALYSMSKKISALQKAVREDGHTLIIYESFRPRDTQMSVAGNFGRLVETNAEVRRIVNTPPWGVGSFIATSLSNHQRGIAIDVSLGRVTSEENAAVGGYSFVRVTGYVEYYMPTAMHELSPLAAAFSGQTAIIVNIGGFETSLPAPVTEGAQLLREYCLDAALTPISSEWWHFSDMEAAAFASYYGITGAFFTPAAYSEAPS